MTPPRTGLRGGNQSWDSFSMSESILTPSGPVCTEGPGRDLECSPELGPREGVDMGFLLVVGRDLEGGGPEPDWFSTLVLGSSTGLEGEGSVEDNQKVELEAEWERDETEESSEQREPRSEVR